MQVADFMWMKLLTIECMMGLPSLKKISPSQTKILYETLHIIMCVCACACVCACVCVYMNSLPCMKDVAGSTCYELVLWSSPRARIALRE